VETVESKNISFTVWDVGGQFHYGVPVLDTLEYLLIVLSHCTYIHNAFVDVITW
jgi:hypothetical protein